MASGLASCPSINAAGLPSSAVTLKKRSAVSAIIVGIASRSRRTMTVSMRGILSYGVPCHDIAFGARRALSVGSLRDRRRFCFEDLQGEGGRALDERRTAARDLLGIPLGRSIGDAAHQRQRFALSC